jgi:hypothetical protein
MLLWTEQERHVEASTPSRTEHQTPIIRKLLVALIDWYLIKDVIHVDKPGRRPLEIETWRILQRIKQEPTSKNHPNQ